MAERHELTHTEFSSLGGKKRASTLSPERRAEIARQAALARWAKKKKQLEHSSTEHPDMEDKAC